VTGSPGTPDRREGGRIRRPARVLWAVALLVCPLSAAGALEPAGQEPSGPAGTEPSAGAGTPEVPAVSEPSGQAAGSAEAASEGAAYAISLSESIERALRRNLDIAVRRITPDITAALVTREEAVFDSSLDFITLADESSEPTSSTLGGADVITDETRSLEVQYNDPLPSGGRYRLMLRGLRSETNSAFATVNPSFFSQWELSFSQPLLKNFGLNANRTRLEVARNSHAMSRSDFRQTVLQVVSDVEKAYWELAFRILDLEVKNQSLELAQDLLRLNRTKVQVGTLAPIEITQAEAGVADREEAVIVAQNEIRNAEDRLKRLMGPPSDPIWALTLRPMEEPPFDESIPELQGSLELAMQHRPDLERARLNLQTREVEYRLARNQRRLDLQLDASYGARGLAGEFTDCRDPSGVSLGAIDQAFFTAAECALAGGTPVSVENDFSDAARQARERDADTWRVGLNLKVPLGNRDARSRYIAARLTREQAEIELRQQEQTATVEVRQSVRQIETDIKRVKAARVNSRLQKEKLEAEQKKFENGISTSFNVLEFQEDLAQARSRENLALVDYNKSRAEMQRVLGSLSADRDIGLRP